ncbi:hypothetical protein BGZ68_002025 [Mortierella alpina]|nr:hypothetical protein BGZ68_002025 [Mortierella alpina]
MPHQRGSPGSRGRGRGSGKGGNGGRGGAGGYRQHPYSEHSRGRGGGRGGGGADYRGNTRGRGNGRGIQGSREHRRRYHDDRPDDDYIPLSGKARGASKPRVTTKSTSRPRHEPKRSLSGKQKDKRFVKAARAGSYSEDDFDDAIVGYNYENDEGIDSDEADQSEDEYLMQGFDWSEADQDPDQKSKAHSRAAQLEPEPESCIAMSGWGGALVYQRPDEKKK